MHRAYAKINLGLLVVEKLPDGYHNIKTIFHRIDLFDVIRFEASSTIQVSSSTPEAPSDESNICHKAAQLLQEHLGIDSGVRISIEKNIPVGAGLGGGSSDAATVLRELPKFWGRSVDERTLRSLALQLGADVPYFLVAGSALAKGRGNILEYFHLEIPFTILVCYPNIPISTAWAYQQVRPNTLSKSVSLRDSLLDGIKTPKKLADSLRNDFELPVFKEHPEILRVKEAMMKRGAEFASMSGSGSAVYGFFFRDDVANTLAKEFQAQGYKTSLTRPGFSPK